MRKIIFFIFISFFLVGCQTVKEKTDEIVKKENEKLSAFIGKSVSNLKSELIEKWCPVHQYVGGIEHAVLHLLYSRFIVKALNSINEININEPFKGLFCQGMVCHKTYKDDSGRWVFPEDVEKSNNHLIHKSTGKKVFAIKSEKSLTHNAYDS